MAITEVDVLTDYGITLDHFYSIVKKGMGQLAANSYLQIQATAVPFDISKEYIYYSLGNIGQYGDMTIAPLPVSNLLLTNPLALLSVEYYAFISELLALVEIKELDPATLVLIDKYTTANTNLQSHINILRQRLYLNWQIFADSTMTPKGDLVALQHWLDGQPDSTEIYSSEKTMHRNQALIEGLRIRQYPDPSHQQVVDAFAKFCSPASRTRYPRYDDRMYMEEQAKFNPVYFARLADNDSSAFANRQITRVLPTIDTISTGQTGQFTDAVSKLSQANSSITTDWNASGSGGWGPISFKANASSHQAIKDDFKHTQSITVAAKSLQALQLDMSAWFTASLFTHPLLAPNRRVFERFLGLKGTLRYLPTHLIVARGFRLEFHSQQDWAHDYKSDFSVGGSASATFFGIGWGGGGSYSKSVHEQQVEQRGHDLVLDDGENIRLIGYNVVENVGFLNAVEALTRDAVGRAFG
ncbi:hypothetical protein OX462_05160 [Janthinobacterium sp. SUN098]|uniref:hypothetical protein n=1 Tax=Janthinobacterium sp. SUN098 TaxID=3002437 RepID=UPI0038D4CE1E